MDANTIALFINTLALLVVVYQTWLTERALRATKESIDNAKVERQLEVLPKFGWVIHVQVDLEKWKRDLSEKRQELREAIRTRNATVLQRIAKGSPNRPQDLGLRRSVYDNMPSWIREIWVSGAQYYYDAASPLSFVWRDGAAHFDYAESWVKDRGQASERAISILLSYIKDMVPPVILSMPARLSDNDFLRD